jgi:hypothetical protein
VLSCYEQIIFALGRETVEKESEEFCSCTVVCTPPHRVRVWRVRDLHPPTDTPHYIPKREVTWSSGGTRSITNNTHTTYWRRRQRTPCYTHLSLYGHFGFVTVPRRLKNHRRAQTMSRCCMAHDPSLSLSLKLACSLSPKVSHRHEISFLNCQKGGVALLLFTCWFMSFIYKHIYICIWKQEEGKVLL